MKIRVFIGLWMISFLCEFMLAQDMTHKKTLAYTANRRNEIFEIDIDSLKVIRSISMSDLWMAQCIDISKDGKYLYVAGNVFSSIGNVFPGNRHYPLIKLDTNSFSVIARSKLGISEAEIEKSGISCLQIKLSPNGKEIYVSTEFNGTIVLDTENLNVVRKIDSAYGPKDILFSPNNDFVYFNRGNRLDIISSKTGKLVGKTTHDKKNEKLNLSQRVKETTATPVYIDKYGLYIKDKNKPKRFISSFPINSAKSEYDEAKIKIFDTTEDKEIDYIDVTLEYIKKLGESLPELNKMTPDKKAIYSTLNVETISLTPDNKKILIPFNRGYRKTNSYIAVIDINTKKVIGEIQIDYGVTNVVFGYK